MKRSDKTKKEERTLPVIEEEIEIHQERVETGAVRVKKQVHTTQEVIEASRVFEDVEITRKRIDAFVDEAEPVRQQGDTTIISIYEEVPVVEKRLKLKEEIHITRHRRTEQGPRTVEVRREDVLIERSDSPGTPSP